MGLNWFRELQKMGYRGYFNVFNTTDIVRKAVREWSSTAKPGRTYYLWQIRQDIAAILKPILFEEAKKVGTTKQAATMYLRRHFELKEAQTSTYDKIIYNTLIKTQEWSIRGKSAKIATYVKL
jgi:hypothetical protein